MAITVIKHGRKVYKAVCPTCGCEFLYNDEDIEYDKDERYGLYIEPKFVKCPDCDSKLDIEPRPRFGY